MSIGTSVVVRNRIQPELLKERGETVEPRTRLDHQPKGKNRGGQFPDVRNSVPGHTPLSLLSSCSWRFLCALYVHSFCHQAVIDCFPVAIWKSWGERENSAIVLDQSPVVLGQTGSFHYGRMMEGKKGHLPGKGQE